jgi:hypothetical protein
LVETDKKHKRKHHGKYNGTDTSSADISSLRKDPKRVHVEEQKAPKKSHGHKKKHHKKSIE